MWYADTVGLKKVYDRVCEFEWTPAPLLKQLAEREKTFAHFDLENRNRHGAVSG
jgi:3-hydroxyacyl-CoA dehydrogenase